MCFGVIGNGCGEDKGMGDGLADVYSSFSIGGRVGRR